MALLEVDNLVTEFRTRSRVVRAVDDVSFHVAAGELLALVGESGCGKSVTALSVMGLIGGAGATVAGGRVSFDGRDLSTASPRQMRAVRGTGMAMVFQDPMTSLNPALTVGRQITESLRSNLRLDKRSARNRAIELLRMVGIPEAETRLDAYPHQFSGGMRQRVMIAIALACSPRLVLADEITTALDVTIQAQILELLKGLAADLGTAVVMITHDLGIVAGMAQRVAVMYGGQIVEETVTTELFANPRMPYTWGLLTSIPRLDTPRHEPLVPIDGTPPDLADPPPGCRFEPRCIHARPICATRPPALAPVGAPGGPRHLARCWATQHVDGGGWLADVHWRDAPRHAARRLGEGNSEEVVEVAEVAVGTRRLPPSVARIGDE